MPKFAFTMMVSLTAMCCSALADSFVGHNTDGIPQILPCTYERRGQPCITHPDREYNWVVLSYKPDGDYWGLNTYKTKELAQAGKERSDKDEQMFLRWAGPNVLTPMRYNGPYCTCMRDDRHADNENPPTDQQVQVRESTKIIIAEWKSRVTDATNRLRTTKLGRDASTLNYLKTLADIHHHASRLEQSLNKINDTHGKTLWNGLDAALKDFEHLTDQYNQSLKALPPALRQQITGVAATQPFNPTGLLNAASDGRLDEVRSQLAAGTDVNAAQNDGWTALMYAADRGHPEVVQLLIQQKASVAQTNADGNTALAYAAVGGHVQIVRALLAAGADPNVTNKDGISILTAAKAVNADSIVNLLRQAGAR